MPSRTMSPEVPYRIFPSEYLSKGLAAAPLACQGLWFRMEMLMTYTDRFGYLSDHGRAMAPLSIARRCGLLTLDEYLPVLEELEKWYSVPREKRTGIIYSPGLIENERLRQQTRQRQQDFRDRLKLIDQNTKG